MGGPAPLGYRVGGKKAARTPDRGGAVFSRYLELESLTVLLQDLAWRGGIGTKERCSPSGAFQGGNAFGAPSQPDATTGEGSSSGQHDDLAAHGRLMCRADHGIDAGFLSLKIDPHGVPALQRERLAEAL